MGDFFSWMFFLRCRNIVNIVIILTVNTHYLETQHKHFWKYFLLKQTKPLMKKIYFYIFIVIIFTFLNDKIHFQFDIPKQNIFWIFQCIIKIEVLTVASSLEEQSKVVQKQALRKMLFNYCSILSSSKLEMPV